MRAKGLHDIKDIVLIRSNTRREIIHTKNGKEKQKQREKEKSDSDSKLVLDFISKVYVYKSDYSTASLIVLFDLGECYYLPTYI